MFKLRIMTAGESHGRGLVGILEGFPANVPISHDEINHQLARRQLGYGRGGRMKIEQDQADVISGLRSGKTLGSPISVVIWNRDWENWQKKMDPWGANEDAEVLTAPRPGHADFAGWYKYRPGDIRNILERASARETAVRVALSAFCRQLLRTFGIEIMSHVVELGGVRSQFSPAPVDESVAPSAAELRDLNERADHSPVRCLDSEAERQMMEKIDHAMKTKDTVGGTFEIVVAGLPPGLGSHVHWDRRLDGLLAQALVSIPAIKGVEFGLGFGVARRLGSEVHDEFLPGSGKAVRRATNRAGGTEGGMTTGQPLVLRASMKPLPTLMRPLRTIDLSTGEQRVAFKERSDVCAVPAASVVGEATVAYVLAGAFCDKFGNDSLEEIRTNYEAYLAHLEGYGKPLPLWLHGQRQDHRSQATRCVA